MPTYKDKTHTRFICANNNEDTSLNIVTDTKHRIKVKPHGFFKTTNRFCFKPAVIIKYTRLEKNVQ